MKRILIALCLMVLIVTTVHAAGSATITPSPIQVLSQIQRKVLSIAVVGGTSGAFTDSTITAATYGITGWYLYTVETIPGTGVPPGGVYAVTLKDVNGYDLAGGLLTGRSTTSAEMVNIGNATHGYPIVRGNITLGIDTLTTTSATTTIILTFVAQ
jgi:hypothetical protein